MPRAPRVILDGGVYHVYNRVSRGEHVFTDESEAGRFVARIAEVSRADELVVMAWCVMSNHYHLAIRTGNVPLSRTMKRIQHRFSQSYNGRRRIYGPFWQGRYKAKLVQDDQHLKQLILYTHLNPVTAGLVDEPGEYRWSGHREIVSRSKKSRIVDRDETLFLFGPSRGAALKQYRKAIEWTREEHWVQGVPGTLPWWRLGRPPRKGGGVSLELDAERTRIGMDGLSTGPVRDVMPLEIFVECSVAELGCAPEQIASRTIEATVVEARETIALLGIERYGYRVKDLAAAFAKNPETVSRMIGRALRRKAEDKSYRRLLDKLDRKVADRARLSRNGTAK